MPTTESLVIAPQWIGDAVMTEPLLRRLAARGERLTVGALPWVAPVYRAMPQVAEVVEFPFAHGGLQWQARRALARALQGRFQTAYVCPNSLKSALLPWLAGIPRRVGYQGEMRLGLLTQRLPNPPKGQRPPMVAFYSALSGQPHLQGDRPALQVPAAQVQAVLAQHHLTQGGYLVLVPGAEYGPAKRWPVARFAALAQQLQARGETVLLLGSTKEAALGDEICAQAQPLGDGASATSAVATQRCRNLAGRTPLDEALALIAGARAMVSNDTGLMHVAAALDVPQVALFGSSSPRHTPPLSPLARVIWLKDDAAYQPALDCAPCFARTCPLGHLRCLNDITPERVLQALDAA